MTTKTYATTLLMLLIGQACLFSYGMRTDPELTVVVTPFCVLFSIPVFLGLRSLWRPDV